LPFAGGNHLLTRALMMRPPLWKADLQAPKFGVPGCIFNARVNNESARLGRSSNLHQPSFGVKSRNGQVPFAFLSFAPGGKIRRRLRRCITNRVT